MVNKYIFYLNEYLINIPLYLIHELSHYIVAFFVVFLYRMDDIPRIKITRKAYIEYKKESYCCYETGMCVEYTSIPYNIGDFIITLAPAITTVFILYITFNINIWLFLFIITKLNKLWLSSSDIKQLKDYINIKKDNQFDCYKIWRPNIPDNGCKQQCKECKEKQLSNKLKTI